MDDLISRQAALDAMYELCNTGETLKENPWRDNPHIDAITDVINNLPSVNPQEPTDTWSIKDVADTFKKHGLIVEQEPCEDAISRAEAIRIASGYCHYTNIPTELAKLPSVTPKHCEDAVSRELVKKDIARWIGYIDEDMIARMHITIDKLPSVSTEKTGRWKKIKSGDKTFPEIIVCSRCGGENSYISEWDRNNNPLSKSFRTTKYGPNCGAKMEGAEE